LEVIMSTTSITQRPASFLTAAAAVLALAAGGVALSISQQSDNPSAPGQHQSQTQDHPNTPQSHHFHATTSGGKVMLGQ
jgi:negative regulator of sigma E activity